jgi:hypothetical protein
LNDLNIERNSLTSASLKAIADNENFSSLETLSMSRMKFLKDEEYKLFFTSPCAQSLRHLDLSQSLITDLYIEKIFDAKNLPSLRTLNLDRCDKISDKGFATLFTKWKPLYLTKLSMNVTKIAKEGMNSLISVDSHVIRFLQYLEMEECKELEDGQFKDFFSKAQAKNLISLFIGSTKISSAGFEAFLQSQTIRTIKYLRISACKNLYLSSNPPDVPDSNNVSGKILSRKGTADELDKTSMADKIRNNPQNLRYLTTLEMSDTNGGETILNLIKETDIFKSLRRLVLHGFENNKDLVDIRDNKPWVYILT